MGKGILLMVVATALGGSILLFSTQIADVGAARRVDGVEADVLARELAASGRRLLLSEALTPSGFRSSAPFTERSFDGGRVMVDDYAVVGDSLVFELTAFHSGAAHRIRSAYTWFEGDFPGPVLVSAPYLFADVSPDAAISGGVPAAERRGRTRRSREPPAGVGRCVLAPSPTPQPMTT